ncbi:MAG: dihydrofolate reductase [Ruminococcus sp.]|nr:dihydrofolate reductase [Ruminococcus sp.]
MSKLIMIAAVGNNNELGYKNNLIWRLKNDLKYFKDNTMNHKIVMGYNTFVSFPKLLPGREHIVLTHRDLQIEGVMRFSSYEELIQYLQTLEEDVFIIGGASIYKLFINDVDEMLLTEINAEFREADAYFPEFNKNDFDKDVIGINEENGINYQFARYRRKK